MRAYVQSQERREDELAYAQTKADRGGARPVNYSREIQVEEQPLFFMVVTQQEYVACRQQLMQGAQMAGCTHGNP